MKNSTLIDYWFNYKLKIAFIQKARPEHEIWISCLLYLAGNLNVKVRIVNWNIYFWDLTNPSHFLKKANFNRIIPLCSFIPPCLFISYTRYPNLFLLTDTCWLALFHGVLVAAQLVSLEFMHQYKKLCVSLTMLPNASMDKNIQIFMTTKKTAVIGLMRQLTT